MSEDFSDMEAKWQARWMEEGLHLSERDDREKFMIIFAYPGVTGYLHVGHMRGYTYVDAISRYKRMQGYNVLFPVGTHATGNGAISLAARIARRDEATVDYLLRNGCPEDRLGSLTTPEAVVDFFNDIYVNDYWKRFGFLADWRRFTCTIYPDYQRFMQWQFIKLNEAGLLIQKPYYAPACVECGPVAVDASETDISKGGNAETFEYTLLKFRCGDQFLVAATLRPETVYGQTNFWVNPDVTYVRMRKGDETWIVSHEAYDKMTYQMDDVELVGEIEGTEMMGWLCEAPVIHRRIPVLPARFCDPNVGTGLVTSVPSDAPDDWVALKMLKQDQSLLDEVGLDRDIVEDIRPIAIIDTKGYGPMPGVDLVEAEGIERSGHPKLEELKKRIYKDSYHTGRMNADCDEFAGLRVEEAKDRIRQKMLDEGEAELFYDLSEEVVCRCGRPVVIRKVPDQWFIDYADPELTLKTKEHAKGMDIHPSEYMVNVQGVLDWFRERACVRQGNWLGTRFPFDDRWIIEAISDSTLYPVYYLISRYVNEGQVPVEALTPEFFDLVVIGEGDVNEVSAATGVDVELLQTIKDDVSYWYPLDMNLGGKEHMTVHFPAFLFNHVAIMPEPKRPRGIFVNWYITGKKGKISKSKGGAQPIPGAAERFGVDAMRLYYSHVASPFADVEWDDDTALNYRQRLERIRRTIEEVDRLEGDPTPIDDWLKARMSRRIGSIEDAMEAYDLRTMATEVYFETLNDLRWYVRRGGCCRATIDGVIDMWIRMMVPITPHTAEELWSTRGNQDLVSSMSYPEPIEAAEGIEVAEGYLRDVLDDINEILKVTGIRPSRLAIYTAPSWKRRIWGMAIEMQASGTITIPALTKAAMTDPEIRSHGKAASEYARKLASELSHSSDEDMNRMAVKLDESSYLASSTDFLSQQYDCEIMVLDADQEGLFDPAGKSRAAQPRRPAIYVE